MMYDGIKIINEANFLLATVYETIEVHLYQRRDVLADPRYRNGQRAECS